jgi:hypothetical protein
MDQTEKGLSTAKAHATGSRDGTSHTSDGRLDGKLSPPGTAGAGTNPEQLFAPGWVALMQLVLFSTTGLVSSRHSRGIVARDNGGPVAPSLACRQRLKQLQERLRGFAGELSTLEELLAIDVASSLNKVRFITEKALHELCVSKATSWGEAEPTLERMKGPLVARRHIPRNISIHLDTIQRNASAGSHYQEHQLSHGHVSVALIALVEFLDWYAGTAGTESGLAASVQRAMEERPEHQD